MRMLLMTYTLLVSLSFAQERDFMDHDERGDDEHDCSSETGRDFVLIKSPATGTDGGNLFPDGAANICTSFLA